MASKKITLTLVCLSIIALLVGCGSDNDSSPVAPAVDTAPPALPGNLAVQYVTDAQQACISWDANVTDADFEGYLVSRSIAGAAPVALITEPQAANSFQEKIVDAGSQVTYYIYSVDTSDNVSAAATVSLSVPAPVAERTPDLIRM